ncbi:lysine transporter LysE [Verrucomicrobia bacterium SCGC AG-212-E04]|nr:lysine transporter LysE [Verrucomicrobia bacterium SCGC AG-212-E04]
MVSDLFLKSLVIGVSIAAPVGPIGVLCIRRSIQSGPLLGLVSGMGAAVADALYGCIAAFGLTSVSSALVQHQTSLRLVGGAFLCYLGLRTFFAKLQEVREPTPVSGYWQAFASTLVLTIANPMTIISFAGVFAALGLSAQAASYLDSALVVLGVFLGSAAWWLFLGFAAGSMRDRVGQKAMSLINRLSGVVIIAFGVGAIAAAFLA